MKWELAELFLDITTKHTQIYCCLLCSPVTLVHCDCSRTQFKPNRIVEAKNKRYTPAETSERKEGTRERDRWNTRMRMRASKNKMEKRKGKKANESKPNKR